MKLKSSRTKIALAGGGVAAALVLAGTIAAQAATSSPTTSPTTASPTTTAPSTGSTAVDPHPGDNGADGVPESQEVHGGRGGHDGGGALSLSGTVTAVGTSTVTIKTATTTTTYDVTSTSDIDKNGEATLKDLVVGDKVTFSVESSNAKQIDKLHSGDESKNLPQPRSTSSATSGSGA